MTRLVRRLGNTIWTMPYTNQQYSSRSVDRTLTVVIMCLTFLAYAIFMRMFFTTFTCSLISFRWWVSRLSNTGRTMPVVIMSNTSIVSARAIFSGGTFTSSLLGFSRWVSGLCYAFRTVPVIAMSNTSLGVIVMSMFVCLFVCFCRRICWLAESFWTMPMVIVGNAFV